MSRPEMKTDKLPVACFAPPLTDEQVAGYRTLVDSMPLSAERDAINECLKAVEVWWKLPESTLEASERFRIKHQGKETTFAVIPLEEKHVAELWDLIPYQYEIDAMQKLFDGIPTEQKELRDVAFHLLWHVIELNNDREPLTQDRL